MVQMAKTTIWSLCITGDLPRDVEPCYWRVGRSLYCFDGILVMSKGPTEEEAEKNHDERFLQLLERSRERNLTQIEECPLYGSQIAKQGPEGG